MWITHQIFNLLGELNDFRVLRAAYSLFCGVYPLILGLVNRAGGSLYRSIQSSKGGFGMTRDDLERQNVDELRTVARSAGRGGGGRSLEFFVVERLQAGAERILYTGGPRFHGLCKYRIYENVGPGASGSY